MAKNIVRLDIVNGNPRTFIAPQNLENGYFLKITGKADNALLGVEDDYEAYSVELASADTKRADLLFHKSVENMYDERLQRQDFELPEGKEGRGYQLVMGDVITIPVEMCGATVGSGNVVSGIAVGDEVELGAGGKLVKSSTGNKVIGKVEAIEEIVAFDLVQVSAVIRMA